ncbi:DUF6615 family protein [Nucisporomicrobium flavum]|uniref:DUF6615 family protein n=1 Tax=Nucisporomicrobium flavum TaxID=2785915 RepID=UPI0018F35548|nr:DUF6615 family protein [Nucisporomicrobium flavum]
MTTAPVHEADALSGRWKQRFVRESAALGEEAITSDVVLVLEERFAPYVRSVTCFNRAEEGGTHGRAIGADIEIHLITPDGSRHLGYRVQAKLAKQTRARQEPRFDYDLNYVIGAERHQQIDALIASAGSCIPLYFLYNGPDAVQEILSAEQILGNRLYRRWLVHLGCCCQHDMDLNTALTIAAVPARLARRQARLSPTKLVLSASLAWAIYPWSCLFHQGEPVMPSRRAAEAANQRLSLARLMDVQRHRFLELAQIVEQFMENGVEFADDLRTLAETFTRDSSVPDDVARLWRGEFDYDLDELARARPSPQGDGGADLNEVGDMHLRSLLIIEVEP